MTRIILLLRRIGKSGDEWTRKVEIKPVNIFHVGNACKDILRHTTGSREGTFTNSEFLAGRERKLISNAELTVQITST